MKIGIPILVVLLIALCGVVAAASAYRVSEREQIIITEFGKPIGDAVREAGLYWRTPFIQKVNRFEKRLLEHDGDATQIPTRDKKFIYIDTFSRWRISDPLLFYKSVRDVANAKTRLDDIIDSETRDTISSLRLIEVVRNTNRTLLQDDEIAAVQEELAVELVVPVEGEDAPAETLPIERLDDDEVREIEYGREKITALILENAKAKIKDFGIELVDVQIKRINYVQMVQEKVFARMVSEREQIAAKYRAEGGRVFAEFQGRIQKERSRILSEAYREAETIKGEAEGEAARIYSDAYGRDPEFYSFWRSLEVYRRTLHENTSLIISSDSKLFQYLRSPNARQE